MADKYLNSTGVVHLWLKIVDNFISKEELSKFNECVIVGYFYNNLFYEDSSYTIPIEGHPDKIYIDTERNSLYRYCEESGYIQITAQNSASDGSGNGISAVSLNDDYTLTLYFTDGTSYTTSSIRGENGENGNDGIDGFSIYSTSSDAYEFGNNSIDFEFDFELDGLDDYSNTNVKIGDYVIHTTYQSFYKITNLPSVGVATLKFMFSMVGKDGSKGDKGDNGNGIKSITLDEDNSTDRQSVYIITLTDNSTYSFTVTHGTDGRTGKTGNTPRIRINTETNVWEVSLDNGLSWTSTDVNATGEKGESGLSAYQIAVANGFEGTESEWLDSLKGVNGQNGMSIVHEWDGTYLVITSSSGTSSANLKGEKGDTGYGIFSADISTEKASICDLANIELGDRKLQLSDILLSKTTGDIYLVSNIGNSSADLRYIGSLKGTKGETGDVGLTPNITIGKVTTLEEGSSANATITGTPENPILNLEIPKGVCGQDGMSAYDIAVQNGFMGTEAEWLESLNAPNTPEWAKQKEKPNYSADEILGFDEKAKSIIDSSLQESKESGVFDDIYIGSGEMPDGYLLQIDPDGAPSSELPAVTESDNGKVLRVVNGVWAADTISNAEGVGF